MDGTKKEIDILGVPFYPMTWKELPGQFEELLRSGHQNQIARANPEFVMTAAGDPDDAEILKKTAFNVADGAGILWAASFLDEKPAKLFGTVFELLKTAFLTVINSPSIKKVIPARIGGTEFTLTVLRTAAKSKEKVFLLGASDESRQGAKKFLSSNVPELSIVGDLGSFSPFEDAEKIIEAVNKSGASVLIVCFGHPLQEKWIYKNLKNMPRIKVAFGGGGDFDYMSGVQKRAPKFIQQMNLEWLWRFFTQRNRAQKMKKSLPKFVSSVFKAKLLKSRLELNQKAAGRQL